MDNNEKPPSEMKLTIKEAAAHIGESPNVVRNWQKQLKSHLLTKQGDNNYHYFDEEAIERLLLIKQLHREQNYSMKQVEYFLATGDSSFKIPKEDPDTVVDESKIDMLLEQVELMRTHMENQEKFNQELLKRLENQALMYQDKQEETIKAIEDRHQKQIQFIEAKNEIEEPKEKKSFFSKLFSK